MFLYHGSVSRFGPNFYPTLLFGAKISHGSRIKQLNHKKCVFFFVVLLGPLLIQKILAIFIYHGFCMWKTMKKTCRHFFHPPKFAGPNRLLRTKLLLPAAPSLAPLWSPAAGWCHGYKDHRFDAKQHVIVREAACFVDRQKLKENTRNNNIIHGCVYTWLFLHLHITFR